MGNRSILSKLLVLMLSFSMTLSTMGGLSSFASYAETEEPEVQTEQAEQPAQEETAEAEASDEDEPEPVAEETKDEVKFPAFSDSGKADGVTVTVTAEEGTFPEGARLVVRSATKNEEKRADELIGGGTGR